MYVDYRCAIYVLLLFCTAYLIFLLFLLLISIFFSIFLLLGDKSYINIRPESPQDLLSKINISGRPLTVLTYLFQVKNPELVYDMLSNMVIELNKKLLIAKDEESSLNSEEHSLIPSDNFIQQLMHKGFSRYVDT